MEFFLARETVQNYVCARCYGMLVTQKTDDYHELDVICVNKLEGKCDGSGFVTKTYAERRVQESLVEYQEVIQNYPQLAPAKRQVTPKQILSELGF